MTYKLNGAFEPDHMVACIAKVREPIVIVKHPEHHLYGVLAIHDEHAQNIMKESSHEFFVLPPLYPEYLGNPEFCYTHHVNFPYIVGEMANGIATADMVIAASRAGLMGSFGAAGLTPSVIAENLQKIRLALGDDCDNWGSNLIHSPNEPEIEKKTVELYLDFGVRRVSSSAYMSLSPHIVRYAFTGVKENPDGTIYRPNHVLAKLSRPEVAEAFMSPPPQDVLLNLVEHGYLSQQEADLARFLPVAEDVTAESDSGGHTDNRPLAALFPSVLGVSQKMFEKYNYARPVRVGAAGSLGTPSALAAAFSMGAAYVLTGSINQAACEAGVCERAKQMLAKADLADVAMAPAADMFEIGVELQVLKRGTMFSSRAGKLYKLYRQYPDIESIPDNIKQDLEKTYFRDTLDNVWASTKEYFMQRDPTQVHHAEKDPKYKMALIFRAYLGKTSRWAIQGEESRELDFQLWCGPAMGSFNRWVEKSFLEDVENRNVQQIAYNLLEGAAVISRIQQCRSAGVIIPENFIHYIPKLTQHN